MANRPLNMQKIRQILLFLERGFSQRSIERETGINRRTIASYLQRFADSGFSIAELLLFSDAELEAYLNAGKAEQIEKDPRRIHLESQFSYLFSELRRVGVTRQLLWQEYINEYPDGFGYSVSTLWSTSMNNLMLFLALVDEQRRKKSPDVCYDSRLAAERPEQETLLRGKWHQ